MNNSTLSQLTFSMCTTLTLAVASNQNQTATMEKTKTGRRRTLSSSAVDGIYDIDPLAEEQQIIPIEDEGFIDNYKREGSGTIFSSTINLLNTILGSGMLAMPNAIASIGLLPGILLIIISGLASRLGLQLLAYSASRAPHRSASFFSISQLTFPRAAIFFDLAVAIKCFGVAVSYLIVIGDLMPLVVRLIAGDQIDPLILDRRFWILISSICIIPLSLLRRLDSLKYTSLVALTSVCYLVILVIYSFIEHHWPTLPADQTPMIRPTWKFWQKLTVFVFAFTCHQNIFSIHNELRDNTRQRVGMIINNSILIATITYLIVGILGYLMLGLNAPANILSGLVVKYPVMVTVAQLSFTLLVAFSYPLQCHPARASIEKLYLSLSGKHDDDHSKAYLPVEANLTLTEIDQSVPPAVTRERKSILCPHYIITFAILLASYTIAFFVDDLSKVLAFVGATGSVTICYILPSIFYLKLTQRNGNMLTRILAANLLLSGCILMPVCVVFGFIQ